MEEVAQVTEPIGQARSMRQQTDLRIRRRTVMRWSVAVIVVLVVLSTAGQLLTISVESGPSHNAAQWVWLDSEQSLPAWIQSTALLICGLILYIIGRLKRLDKTGPTRAWFALSLLFVGLAVDESTAVHERVSWPLRRLLGGPDIFHFGWVVLGLAVVLVVFLSSIRFLSALDAPTRWMFLGAGGLYVSGALGVEMLGAAHVARNTMQNLAYTIGYVTVEEVLEMAGITVFLLTLLSYLANNYGDVTLHLDFS